MQRIIAGLLVLAFALIGAALIIPALIPNESLRSAAQEQASSVLGRGVELNGEIGLTILPRLEIRANDAQISNAEGFGETPFAEMREMRFTLELWPLLSRQIEIDEFVLVDPVIRLQERNGRNNWSLGAPSESTTVSTSGSETGFVRQTGALPFEASFGDVRIENGSVSYSDGLSTRTIEALNLSIALPSVDQPVSFNGSMNLDGFPTQFDAELGSLRGFFEGARTPLDFNLTGGLADISVVGHFLESSELALDGRIEISLAIRALARYLGTDLPDGETFNHFSADSAVAIRPGVVRLTDGTITFDDILAEDGTLTLNYDRTRPLVTGSFQVENLDITPYMPEQTSAPSQPAPGSGVPPWSTTPMDFSPLRAMDSNLSFLANRFQARDIVAENVAATVEVDNGRLVGELSDVGLYDGIGRVRAVINARQARPSYSLDANLDTLDALPFLQAAAKFERLRGIGSFDLELFATGSSQADIMQSLEGRGEFGFLDGALVGANLAQIIRTIELAIETRSLPSGFASEAETDFSALSGTFLIENGVAQNFDLAMLSPLLRVAGSGTVNLGQQNLDYVLTPRAVAALTGQGGDTDLQGLEVPIQFVGGFNNVDIRVDYGAIAENLLRAQAGDLIGGDIGNALGQGQDLEDVARDAATNAILDALGVNNDEEDGAEADPARQLLRGLLGGRRPQNPPPAEEDTDSDDPN